MKNLIICPHCQEEGIKQTMAEVLPSGFIAVQRFHHTKYGKDYTVITGSSLSLKCGRCGETVFIREQHAISG